MRWVIATFRVEGFHRWPDAHERRSYLASRHRHLFHVRVEVEVDHADRAIECHDLRDFCIENFGRGDFGSKSCEMMAEALALKIQRNYVPGAVIVEVLEDGEVGGRFDTRA